MINLYHCSPVKIKYFNFDKGVHFGGPYSALEAGLRKDAQTLYLHKVELYCDSFYESEDVGCSEEWAKVIEKAKEQGFKAIKYKNKYEPDTVHSYLVFDPDIITLDVITTISDQKAEELLTERY